MMIEEYFGDWCKVIDLNLINDIVYKLKKSKDIICPSLNNVFKSFNLCPLNNLRVIILGQDPYSNLFNNKPVATGIAFANNIDTPIESYSPSLDILRESVIDFTIPHSNVTFDPSLESWEKQGVLMLNSALTCKLGTPGSHMLMWRPFLISLFSKLTLCCPGTVYLLMGSVAQSFEPYINKDFNYILKIKHPSYYARTHTKMPSEIWKQINDILKGQSGIGIEWFKETDY